MTTITTWIRWFAGLLWLTGLWLCFRQPAATPPVRETSSIPLDSAKNYLFISPAGPAALIRGNEQLTQLSVGDSALLLNKETLPIRSDSVGGRRVKTARNLPLWRSQFRYRLGAGATSDAARWEIARRKLASFYANGTVPADISPANDKTDQLLFDQFITFVADRQKTQETTLILSNNLFLNRLTVQTVPAGQTIQLSSPAVASTDAGPSSTNTAGLILLALGGLLWGILIFAKRDRVMAAREPSVPETIARPEPIRRAETLTADETTPIAASTPPRKEPEGAAVPTQWLADQAALNQYMTAFYQRYGDLYERLQTLQPDLTDDEKQPIRRQLVEMALHAHAFAEGFQHLPLTRLIEVPNVRLLVRPSDPLPAADVTNDPYKTPKRFRVLLSVLQDMKLGELENVLLDDLHIPKNLL